jgi:hypothetical protein
MAVKYLSDYTLVDKPVKRKGFLGLLPGQDADGYGKKITTDKAAIVDGKKYRVYCTQYSNAGSYWIQKDGEKLFL